MKTKMRTIVGLAAVVLAFALGGREAAADHVFQLVDVMFDPGIGGTATGTFTTNDALTALLTYGITTSSVTGPPAFPGFEYTPATAPNVTNSLPGSFEVFNGGRIQDLLLVFSGGLTAAGATSVGGDEVFSGSSPIHRLIVSGSVVGVPEPSALVLGGIAAEAGLGLWLWPWLWLRRRRRAAPRVG
jgi:hypothetical protein